MAPAFLICSGVSVSGLIERLCLGLAHETDSVKHIDAGEEPAKDSHKVEFEGLRSLMGENCPSFRVFLGKLLSSDKAAPFWHVKPTDVEEHANMVLTTIAVAVRVSAAMRGQFKQEGACTMLESYICPEVEVKVILPLYVHNRALEVGEKLCFYKAAVERENKRKDPEEIDTIVAWKKKQAGSSKDKDSSSKRDRPHSRKR